MNVGAAFGRPQSFCRARRGGYHPPVCFPHAQLESVGEGLAPPARHTPENAGRLGKSVPFSPFVIANQCAHLWQSVSFTLQSTHPSMRAVEGASPYIRAFGASCFVAAQGWKRPALRRIRCAVPNS